MGLQKASDTTSAAYILRVAATGAKFEGKYIFGSSIMYKIGEYILGSYIMYKIGEYVIYVGTTHSTFCAMMLKSNRNSYIH